MAIKTFPYAVIWNGAIVPANTPIEISEPNKEAAEPKKAVKKNDGRANRKSKLGDSPA